MKAKGKARQLAWCGVAAGVIALALAGLRAAARRPWRAHLDEDEGDLE